jgi:hypothetical protein
MRKMTKEEAKWLDEVQDVLNRCPSKRLGFYTIGDPTVFVFDKKAHDKVCDHMDQRDLVQQLAIAGTGFEEYLFFPAAVDGVCG